MNTATDTAFVSQAHVDAYRAKIATEILICRTICSVHAPKRGMHCVECIDAGKCARQHDDMCQCYKHAYAVAQVVYAEDATPAPVVRPARSVESTLFIVVSREDTTKELKAWKNFVDAAAMVALDGGIEILAIVELTVYDDGTTSCKTVA